jgi:hypothetical protein
MTDQMTIWWTTSPRSSHERKPDGARLLHEMQNRSSDCPRLDDHSAEREACDQGYLFGLRDQTHAFVATRDVKGMMTERTVSAEIEAAIDWLNHCWFGLSSGRDDEWEDAVSSLRHAIHAILAATTDAQSDSPTPSTPSFDNPQ